MADKRRSIDLLPVALQTETLTKFFAATVDHLMQPESVEFLAGYIGSKPSYYNSATDYYVGEPTVERSNYQLPVTGVSVDSNSGMVKDVMFYDDLINLLQFHGANIDNHSRLFEQEYYSWCPPIDPDKLINYSRYTWLTVDPTPITLLDKTDAVNDILGKNSYVYRGSYRTESTGDIVSAADNVGLTITNGLVIILSSDVTAGYNNMPYIISGVGVSIMLRQTVVPSNPGFSDIGFDLGSWDGNATANNKEYITIARYSTDNNQWSNNNRWVHDDVISLARMDVSDLSNQRATRPIIEFNKDMLIWDYGWYGRSDVDLVIYDINDVLGTIVGQTSFTYDGLTLADGMRLLVLSDLNTTVNQRIYTVGGIEEYGVISLTLVADGQNADGSPAYGDRCIVKFGSYEGYNFWFYVTGLTGRWRQGQQYGSIQGPLFQLSDTRGNSLANPTIYPGSDFNGNQVFGYTVDDTASVLDTELGFAAKRDQFGSFVFTNYLDTHTVTYLSNNAKTTYQGYKFYQFKQLTGTDIFGNSWHKAQSNSRQYLINDYLNISVENSSSNMIFAIDQLPAADIAGTPSSIQVYLTRDQQEMSLVNQVDYKATIDPVTKLPILIILSTVMGPSSTSPGLMSGDRITIKTWNTAAPMRNLGTWELPSNLVANPNNQDILTVSQSQLLDQFRQIIASQAGIIGDIVGANNFRDTAQDLTLGRTILQHRAPMLKLMMLSSNDVTTGVLNTQSKTDPMLSMQFAQREYIRFYSRFINSLFNLYSNGYSLNNSVDDWLTTALTQVNLGKTKNSTWANSGYDTINASYTFQQSASPTFVPPTAARLGMSPAYLPTVTVDNNLLVLETHDGSRIVMEDDQGIALGNILNGQMRTSTPRLLSHPIAKAWLQFELNLYNDMPAVYSNPDAPLTFNTQKILPGKWRKTDYSYAEYIGITQPMFDKWVDTNQVDFVANTTFDINDPFTWNYRGQVDQDNLPVQGNWRGIYRWFYDTDRPHTHPWEMLGFSQKPVWWDKEYGTAPYTSGNTKLWYDLRDGRIRQGLRQGIDATYARSGLMSCLPVDAQGRLLPPGAAGTVKALPGIQQSKAEWQYGDGAPIESVWVHSQDHSFAIAQVGYLMKPAQFVEQCWDILRTEQIYPGTPAAQWIYIDTNSRRTSSQFYVHRENPAAIQLPVTIPNESMLTYYGSGGLQHWISEYLINNSLNVTTYFGSLVRGAQPRLAHKTSGFVNSTSLRFTADSFGQIGYQSQLIPSENVNIYLYRSTSIGESFYGGVIVKQVSSGYQVYGYDGINPAFNVIPSNMYGSKVNQVIGNQSVTLYTAGQQQDGKPIVTSVPYGTVFGARQDVYDFIISYGRYLVDQGWVFDGYDQENNILIDWKQVASEFIYWSQTNWADGNFIALSPLANSAKFVQQFGNIEFVNGVVGGTYPVVDKTGSPIDNSNLEILRYDSEIVVRPVNEQTLFGLRLFRTTIENIIVFDNVTSFNDIIYDDIFAVYQPRLKMYAYRTNDWNGRLDAPGYILYQKPADGTWTMLPNLEKTAEDTRRYFNIEQPKNFDLVDPVTGAIITDTSRDAVVDRGDIADLAKHMFGYQKRQWLQDLLLEDSTEFQFYQGYVKQKGTKSAINRLIRNTSVIPLTESFQYYEEYALRAGRFGAVALNTIAIL